MRLKSVQHKYRAKSCVIDGIGFPSLKEGARYKELRLLEKAGEIEGLQLQPKFRLVVAGELIAVYIADFIYLQRGAADKTVEDCKGYRTRDYRLKAKLFKALFPNFNFVES